MFNHNTPSSAKPLTKDYLLTASRRFETGIIFQLDLSSLSLGDVSPLGECSNLYTLDLSRNKVSDISCFETLPNLNYANLSFNLITNLKPLASCIKLTGLDLRSNQIQDIVDIKALSKLTNLQSINFMDFTGDSPNPVCQNPSYRTKVCQALKNVQRIDSVHRNDSPPVLKLPPGSEDDMESLDLKEGDSWYGDISALSTQLDSQKKRESKMQIYTKRVEDASKKVNTNSKKAENAMERIARFLEQAQ